MDDYTPRISVVIVTRNRAVLLKKVIHSLLVQTVLPDEILIVDNHSEDETKKIVLHLQGLKKVLIRYAFEKKIGYPIVHNTGLKNAAYKWVAFIDDDCIADKNWVRELKRSIQKNSDAVVILGESKTLYPQNIFSLTIYLLDQNWKKNRIHGQRILNYEILDNKNIVYNNPFLKKHRIAFDEKRVCILHGAAEDCDLGKQIEKAGGVALYQKMAVVSHLDPTHFFWFCKRYIKSYAAYLFFAQKWPQTNSFPSQIGLKKLIVDHLAKYRYSSIQQVALYIFLSLVVGVSIILQHIIKNKRMKQLFIQFAEKI